MGRTRPLTWLLVFALSLAAWTLHAAPVSSACEPAAKSAASKGLDIAIRGDVATDAAMCRHFTANKSDFEKLVSLYQTDKRRVWERRDGSLIPIETKEYRALLDRLGLEGLSDDGVLWLPDPYKEDLPQRAKGLNAFTAYQYHGIFFRTDRSKYGAREARFGRAVWKEYFFTPQDPLVKDGELWWPRSQHGGDLYRSSKLLDSLDKYPASWQSGSQAECAYKRIDVRWFLRLCRA